MITLQYIANAVKSIQSRNQHIQKFDTEPLIICQDYKIETYQLIDIKQKNKKKKLTANQETQTQELPIQTNNSNSGQTQQGKNINIIGCQKDNSKKTKKIVKHLSKQVVDVEKFSQNSEQTEPSQISYCQRHFLYSLQKNEEEFKIYLPTKVSQLKQTKSKIFNKYINNLRESLVQQRSIIETVQDEGSKLIETVL
ncbi:unnamed protein product [Paramecium sonneborni]|uniref:Uncharacterized protein n=1 Tax=Paramecium sonneborni TaxID=65129 RepID=A0A8S1M1S1_9CILI|nr:unnamed protein product [Paramecium sonneborni]